MRVIYYYFRNDENKPITTICLLINGDITCIGRADCSPKDNPCKKTGRSIAYERAIGAFMANKDIAHNRNGDPKGFFCPKLTPFEQKLIS